jgi:hypothetical protein
VVTGGRRKAEASSTRLTGRTTEGSPVRRCTMIATHQIARSAHNAVKIGAPAARDARVSTSRPSHVARIAVTPCAVISRNSATLG